MKNTSRFALALFAAITAIFIVSCSDDSSDALTGTVWQYTAAATDNTDSYAYNDTLSFYSGGTFSLREVYTVNGIQDYDITFEGTYALSGTTLTMSTGRVVILGTYSGGNTITIEMNGEYFIFRKVS